MNDADYKYIEAQLNVTLPEAFKSFMRQFPNDVGHRLVASADVMECNAELFVIAQLHRLRDDKGFDYYEQQPELRTRRFIEIGGDGCGNYYWMVGDDAKSNALWIWSHDPYDGFVPMEDRLLSAYLESEWTLETQDNPFDAVKGTFIIRADHPRRGVARPIKMQEWLDYVASRTDLELDETYTAKNPFTGEDTIFRRWPGRVRLKTIKPTAFISYSTGSLEIGPTPIPNVEIERIARDLNATVWRSRDQQT